MSQFLVQLRGELRKLFARKRTYIGFGAFLALEIVILMIFQVPRIQRRWSRMLENAGYGFDDYFSGTTLAFQMVIWTAFMLGGLYVALVSGDIVAKEVEEGTMRMTLCRPISRVRLGVLKYCACVIYTMVLVAFIGLSARMGEGWQPRQAPVGTRNLLQAASEHRQSFGRATVAAERRQGPVVWTGTDQAADA